MKEAEEELEVGSKVHIKIIIIGDTATGKTSVIKRYIDADSWYESTFINISDYDRLQDIMLYGKTIDKKINADDLITNEFN